MDFYIADALFVLAIALFSIILKQNKLSFILLFSKN